MKKIILSAIAVILACTSAMAQFRWGPVAGVNFSSVKFSQELFTMDSHIGGQAGVMCEMMFPGIGFGIDFGAMYQMRGATFNLGEKKIWASDGYGKESFTGHFLTIPVDLRFKWTRMNGIEDYVAPYIFGGPLIGFQLAHTSLHAFRYSTLDFGIQAGFGVQLFKVWQVQGAYSWGMTDSFKAQKLFDFNGSYNMWTVSVIRYF